MADNSRGQWVGDDGGLRWFLNNDREDAPFNPAPDITVVGGTDSFGDPTLEIVAGNRFVIINDIEAWMTTLQGKEQ